MAQDPSANQADALTGEAVKPAASLASLDHSDATLRRTSDWVAAVRADEYTRPDRLIDDPYAAILTDEEAFATMRGIQALGPLTELVTIRGRLGDQALHRAVANGIGQAVCLGAGSDTRAWRCRLLASFHYFELDLPGQSLTKARLIEKAIGAQPTCQWHPVETDLHGDWAAMLVAAGLRTDRPVLWIAEGILHYLSRLGASELIRGITDLSVPGSLIVGDVLESELYTHPPYQPLLERLTALGVALTAQDQLGRWLASGGWQARIYRLGDLLAGTHPLLGGPLPSRFDIDLTGIGFFLGAKEGMA